MDNAAIVDVKIVVLVLFKDVTVPPTLTDAQLIVPVPCIVAAVFPLALFCRVMPLVSVRVTLGLTVNIAAEVLLLLKVIEVIVAAAVTGFESPARMTTVSTGAGTVPPGQG